MSQYFEKCTLDCFLSEDEKAIHSKYHKQKDDEYAVIAFDAENQRTQLYLFNFTTNRVNVYRVNGKDIDESEIHSLSMNPSLVYQTRYIINLLSQSMVKPTIDIRPNFIDFVPTTYTFYRDPDCMDIWYEKLNHSETVEEFEQFYLDLDMDLRIRCGLTLIQLIIDDEDISFVISKEDSYRVKGYSLDYHQGNVIRYNGHKLNISKEVLYNALKETILLFKTKTINYYIDDIDADGNRVLEIPILKAFLEYSYR